MIGVYNLMIAPINVTILYIINNLVNYFINIASIKNNILYCDKVCGLIKDHNEH